jgi:hypothetical protein
VILTTRDRQGFANVLAAIELERPFLHEYASGYMESLVEDISRLLIPAGRRFAAGRDGERVV